MSTSPSWFDQEKFSRLVKKVGPKNVSEAPPAPATPPPATPPPTKPASQPFLSSPSASQPLPSPSGSQPLPKPDNVPAHTNGPSMGSSPAPGEGLASTARISLVSKPPSLLSEHRALPALPRRTTPLPGLKSLFQYPSAGDKSSEAPAIQTPPPIQPPPVQSFPFQPPSILPPPIQVPPISESPAPAEPAATKAEPVAKSEPFFAKPEPALPKPEPSAPVESAPALPKLENLLADDENDLSGIWQKMALLNEELAQTIQERDHANSDINLLREQLRQADEALEKSKSNATPDELAHVAKERDAAVAELDALKEKLPTSDSQKIVLPDGVTKTKELVFLTGERDQARKEYAELRKQFEMLKRDQTGSIPNVREESSKFRKEMEQQLEGFRVKLEEKNREIAELKANSPAASPAPVAGGGENDEKLKEEVAALKAELAPLKAEVATLKEQLQKAKEDTSIAQRGLALSQKALQETRDTLREATEGTSLSRHNFDNLKNECAALTQQNTVLQAQNEQLARELAAAKQRQSGRLSA